MQNNFAKLSPEDLKIISEAQEKLNQSSGKAVALVAYEVQVQFITVTHKNTLLTGLSSKEGTYQNGVFIISNKHIDQVFEKCNHYFSRNQ